MTFSIITKEWWVLAMPSTTGAILQISLRVGIIPLNVPSRHVFLTILLSLYSQRVQKPLQWALMSGLCTKLRLNHHWFILRSKKSICTDQRVVSRPIAGMALLLPFTSNTWLVPVNIWVVFVLVGNSQRCLYVTHSNCDWRFVTQSCKLV